MKRALVAALVVVAVAAGFFFGRRDHVQPAPAPSPAPVELVGAALLDGLGDYSFPVTTSSPEAQRWFNQGLMLAYGFNHDAAERSFLKATELDPDCAMCWWGAALVLGPHVNSGMEPANNAKAWTRLQTAVSLAPKSTEREQAFIRALSARYAENPPEDRRPLDEAYAASAGQLAAARPDDLDAAVFHAEAMMDLQPWDFYDEQLRPKGNTAKIVSELESLMARNPDHAGALHLYVHAAVRQTLGVALLAAAQPVDAEAVYREELKRNPANGWSLRGLAESLRAQKRGREAAETEQLLAAAWANADVQLAASRL